jgi:tetratricopeptide (TPR) repeat protein/transcriptional regulator with XRE-family HTH domain
MANSNKKHAKNPNVRLRNAREEHGWSQKQLAELLGTTSVNVSRWENGTTFPSPYYLNGLQDVLGKTLPELGLIAASTHIDKIWHVPHAHNPFFTGRETLITSLEKRFSQTRTAILPHTVALYGLGGTGKTQIALEYAFRYRERYTYVFWVQATNRETLISGLAELAELLGVPHRGSQNQQRGIQALKQWLSNNKDWLLILDDANDLPLVQTFLPVDHQGHLLFTTYSQVTGTSAEGIEVQQMDLDEGCLLLLHRAKVLKDGEALTQASAENQSNAQRIVKEMGCLPLALVQAAAYIEETGCMLAEYLMLYSTHYQELLAHRSAFALDYPETVATTWLLSFQQIEQSHPAASDILRFLAFIAPDNIPLELLLLGSAYISDTFRSGTSDAYEIEKALQVLRKYSFVRRDSSASSLSIHRLVQVVLQQNIDPVARRLWAEKVVRTVNAAFPQENQHTDQKYLRYLPHVKACAALIDFYQLRFPVSAQLLFRVGSYLYFHGLYEQSQQFHQQALEIREQIGGNDRLELAESLNALALLSRVQNDYAQAEKLHLQALDIREKAFRIDPACVDPDKIAESLNNLGVLYRNQHKYDQAEHFLQRALTNYQQYGQEPSGALAIRMNLAKLYIEQEQYERARRILQLTMISFRETSQRDNPLVVQNLNLLAQVAHQQHDDQEAEKLWKRAVEIIEQTLGMHHPALAEIFDQLTSIYIARGDLTQAQLFARQALSISEKALGLEHDDTRFYSDRLASIRQNE